MPEEGRDIMPSGKEQEEEVVEEVGVEEEEEVGEMVSQVESAAERTEKDIWARAELPMSNDAQVEQATTSVWKASLLPYV